MSLLTSEDRPAFDVVHVSSAHPFSDNRVHLREAASTADAGYRTALIAVSEDVPVPSTGVSLHLLSRRSRLARVTLGSLEAVAVAIRLRPQCVHLHDPELVWSVPLFRALRIKVVWDAHEDLPTQVLDKHYLTRGQSRILSRAADAVVRLASTSDAIVTATEQIASRFPPRRTTVVHNFPRHRPQDGAAPSVLSRPLQVGYIGSLGFLRGSQALADAVSRSEFPEDWRLVIAGHFVPQESRRPFDAAGSADRVRLLGHIGPDEARDVLLQTRVGVVTFLPNAAHLEALPTKMFEYLAAGIPVVASDFPLWRRLLEPFDCATFVDPTSGAQIAAAVRAYADDPVRLARHSANASSAARTAFSWTTEEDLLIDIYRRLGVKPTRNASGATR